MPGKPIADELAGPSSSTSLSLLQRAQQREDAAWTQLAELYGPLIYRWCRRWGLSTTDAADLCQEAFHAVIKALSKFEHRGEKGAFRAWLKTISRNKVNDWRRKTSREPVRQAAPIDDIAVSDDEHDEDPTEARTESTMLYRRACAMIQRDFNETTWRAFWETTIESRMVGEVAIELGITPNAVYIARSRVLTRLRTEFEGLLD